MFYGIRNENKEINNMKKIYKENKIFLSKFNKDFLQNIILNNNFPFYLENKTTGEEEDNMWFSHKVLERLEKSKNLQKAITSNENIYIQTLDILNNFCKSIDEKPNFFTRINYNLSFNNGKEHSGWHIDHPFYHKQIIIYLNECDPDAKTCIMQESSKEIIKVTPEKFKGICFENLKHTAMHPKFKNRITLVATFI